MSMFCLVSNLLQYIAVLISRNEHFKVVKTNKLGISNFKAHFDVLENETLKITDLIWPDFYS